MEIRGAEWSNRRSKFPAYSLSFSYSFRRCLVEPITCFRAWIWRFIARCFVTLDGFLNNNGKVNDRSRRINKIMINLGIRMNCDPVLYQRLFWFFWSSRSLYLPWFQASNSKLSIFIIFLASFSSTTVSPSPFFQSHFLSSFHFLSCLVFYFILFFFRYFKCCALRTYFLFIKRKILLIFRFSENLAKN